MLVTMTVVCKKAVHSFHGWSYLFSTNVQDDAADGVLIILEDHAPGTSQRFVVGRRYQLAMSEAP